MLQRYFQLLKHLLMLPATRSKQHEQREEQEPAMAHADGNAYASPPGTLKGAMVRGPSLACGILMVPKVCS